MISEENLQQYKIPDGWYWEVDERSCVLELYPSPEEIAQTAFLVRRPVVRVEWQNNKPTSYSWHNDGETEAKEFQSIADAIQYLVTLVGLGMYTL